MNTEQALIGELSHIEYELKALLGNAHVCAIRVQDELIDKIPLPTWGNPPTVLSKPLTMELVKSWFENCESRSGELANAVEEFRRRSYEADITV